VLTFDWAVFSVQNGAGLDASWDPPNPPADVPHRYPDAFARAGTVRPRNRRTAARPS